MDREIYKNFLHNLPSKPYIVGKNNFFISSVFVPFVFLEGEYYLLLQKRTANIRQGGEICFPGGGFDPKIDKNYQEAAIRETMEELGIKRDKIKIDGVFDTLVNPNGKIVNTFVGKLMIDSLDELRIHKKEVEKILIVPVSFFFKKNPKEYKIKIQAQSYYLDKEGKEISILPVKELGLPEKYAKSWG
ncbi:MAG TPA: CoA pyrophosphatase, partial [Candidatus Cloacimonetes bacterium]|nr:CoA pyrophosphatase [Candidatus Cloacimonadota bacterium]